MKKIIYAISILAGATIGAGFFSLPYITSKTGVLIMAAYFLVFGTLVAFLNIFFAKVALKTSDFLRLPGYCQIYLGKNGYRIALFSVIFSSFGIALAYLILGGQFLKDLLYPYIGGGINLYTALYFIAGAALIFFDIRLITKVTIFALFFYFAVPIILFLQGHHFLRPENFPIFTDFKIGLFFLPFGPVLFSLWGASIIPEIEELLGPEKKMLGKIVLGGTLITIIIYLIFIFLVLGMCGVSTSKEAVLGIRSLLGGSAAYLCLLLFGLLTTFTSFITLGLTLKKVFWYDLKISKNIAWALVCFPPFLLFLAKFQDFLKVISLVGGVMLGIEGILIILLYQICEKIPRKSLTFFFTSVMIFIFSIGIIYELIYFIKG